MIKEIFKLDIKSNIVYIEEDLRAGLELEYSTYEFDNLLSKLSPTMSLFIKRSAKECLLKETAKTYSFRSRYYQKRTDMKSEREIYWFRIDVRPIFECRENERNCVCFLDS